MPRESDNYLKYSKQFKQDYTASTADIIDNSKLLFLAREDLTDKSWKALQHKVKLSERVTQMLTKIGKNKILTQTKYINCCSSFCTSLQISQLLVTQLTDVFGCKLYLIYS